VPPAVPARIAFANESEIGFVHEGSWLKSIAGRNLGDRNTGQGPELGIDERKELLRGTGIAACNPPENLGDLTRLGVRHGFEALEACGTRYILPGSELCE